MKWRFWKTTPPAGEKARAEPNPDGDAAWDMEMARPDQPPKWSMGILNDRSEREVPGTVLLLAKPTSQREQNESSTEHDKLALKRTTDGTIILVPQPDDSPNDPLNWASWRRDAALFSIGFYCLVGSGMTPILAAGYTDVSETFGVSETSVALTAGLYMLGMGIGGVIGSPLAILFGKRPVYLGGAFILVIFSVWCALSTSYISLLVARIFQGIGVSPMEFLPSATVAEIFFLHERAYRLGIYTLVFIGSKNLTPLVSAAIIQSLGWRWVFWIVAISLGFCFFLLFFLVPETFWDRTLPQPRGRRASVKDSRNSDNAATTPTDPTQQDDISYANDPKESKRSYSREETDRSSQDHQPAAQPEATETGRTPVSGTAPNTPLPPPKHSSDHPSSPVSKPSMEKPSKSPPPTDAPSSAGPDDPLGLSYTEQCRRAPVKSNVQLLKPWHGRISPANWFKIMLRPFILYAYPAVLWSTLTYSFSVGWLIVLSESITAIYRSSDTYNFSALQAGLVYISPFIGGVLGTAVAGKVSDQIARYLARKNDGVYEPEFRLVMAGPVAFSTAIGLMGYGWSAEERDAWIVPTVFFGVISFGCSLGSTTAITFCVDSYRQYAGEALVTLNFSKNVFHGLVFSLFFTNWLEDDGPKIVFVAIGIVQLAVIITAIPMYIYGKRARMWTARKGMMDKF